MAATNQVPNTHVIRTRIPAVATVGNDANTVCGPNPALPSGTATVTGVTYYPDAARAGADTNSRTLTLYNRGADGLGSTKVAELALTAGVDLAAYVGKAITLQVAANRALAAGEVLAFTSLHVGTGIADPGGLLVVTITRD